MEKSFPLKIFLTLCPPTPTPPGESIHWSQTPTQSSNSSPWLKPEAVDVELTSYALLALINKPNLTPQEIAKATGIVAWLTKQRNAYGGFASTQVTSCSPTCHFSCGLRASMKKGVLVSSLSSRSKNLQNLQRGRGDL